LEEAFKVIAMTNYDHGENEKPKQYNIRLVTIKPAKKAKAEDRDY